MSNPHEHAARVEKANRIAASLMSMAHEVERETGADLDHAGVALAAADAAGKLDDEGWRRLAQRANCAHRQAPSEQTRAMVLRILITQAAPAADPFAGLAT